MTEDYDGPAENRAKIAISLASLAGAAATVFVFVVILRWMRAHHAGYGWAMIASIAYGVLMLAIAFLYVRATGRLPSIRNSIAMKRYNRRSMIAAVIYVAAMLAVAWVRIKLSPVGVPLVLLALAPSLPLLGVLAAVVLYFREETDEFQRRLMLEGCMWASVILLGPATVWGFLEIFAHAPHVPALWAFPIWAVGLSVSRFILAMRYQ